MIRVAEKGSSASLAAMWSAYRRSASSGVENSPKTLTSPHGSSWGFVYTIEKCHSESGEGVVSSGTVIQTLDYYPYGGSRINTGGDVAQRKYIGQFTDRSGLDYLNARYYSGDQGQFVSEDPVFLGNPTGQNLIDPQSLNSYSYANDNPIIFKDPLGKYFELSAGGTFLWLSGSAGIRFDLTGVNAFAAGGAGYGVAGHLVALSYVPGQTISHVPEWNNVSMGADYFILGGSVGGEYDPNSLSLKNPSLNMSLNLGGGADYYLRKEVSYPLFPAFGGPAPAGVTLSNGSNFSTPNYVTAPAQTSYISSSLPSLSSYQSQSPYTFSIPGTANGSAYNPQFQPSSAQSTQSIKTPGNYHTACGTLCT